MQKTGSFLLAFMQQQPTIEATLFDLPLVAMFTCQRMRMVSGAEQITVVEGNFFHDPLPLDHDCVLVAHVTHMFSPERNHTSLQYLRASVAAGTRLLLIDFWTDITHACPLFAALMAGEFLLATGEGDVYSEDEVCIWLAQSGWLYLEHRPLSGASRFIVAEAS